MLALRGKISLGRSRPSLMRGAGLASLRVWRTTCLRHSACQWLIARPASCASPTQGGQWTRCKQRDVHVACKSRALRGGMPAALLLTYALRCATRAVPVRCQ